MQANFSFAIDAPRHLVRITMSGFFTAADILRFIAARDAAMERLTCGANQHLTLVDVRDMQIQSQEAVAGFGKVIHDPRHMSQRLAIVVSASLARMQVQRIAAGRNARYFAEDPLAAEQWLLSNAGSAGSLPASKVGAGFTDAQLPLC